MSSLLRLAASAIQPAGLVLEAPFYSLRAGALTFPASLLFLALGHRIQLAAPHKLFALSSIAARLFFQLLRARLPRRQLRLERVHGGESSLDFIYLLPSMHTDSF